MWITNSDRAKLESAINLWYENAHADVLTKKEKARLVDATRTLEQLADKRKRDNARCAAYIADKRKTNPEYAGNKYKKSKDKEQILGQMVSKPLPYFFL